nr:MAG TPA: hypothetical protein [Caudoviricetes sp.]
MPFIFEAVKIIFVSLQRYQNKKNTKKKQRKHKRR